MARMAWVAAALAMALTPASGLAAPPAGSLKLPALLGDHAMLQRGMAAPAWGWAAPGARVTVRLAGQSASATTGATSSSDPSSTTITSNSGQVCSPQDTSACRSRPARLYVGMMIETRGNSSAIIIPPAFCNPS